VRPAEAMAIDLGTIDLSAADFRVPAFQRNGEATKTGARIVPLLPACKAWLAAQPRRGGYAYDGDRTGHAREMRRILDAARVQGIHDGARHSFISYRTAETRDVARTADECGNSVQVIKTNYRKIVTAEAAERFFTIRPEAPAGNVTSIAEGRQTA
jgi:integrase